MLRVLLTYGHAQLDTAAIFLPLLCQRRRGAPVLARTGSIADTLNRQHPLHYSCALALMRMAGGA